MTKKEFIAQEEAKLQNVCNGMKACERLEGFQMLLINNGGNYTLVLDGCLDESESFDEVYIIQNGKLIQMNSYQLY